MKKKYFEKADIPNQAGFRFIGLTLDENEIECEVIKKEGCYTLKDGAFHRIKGWRPMTSIEQRVKERDKQKGDNQMPFENLTKDQIHSALTEHLTETGSARIKSGALFIQPAENAGWQRIGNVADEAEAKEAVKSYMEHTGYTTDF